MRRAIEESGVGLDDGLRSLAVMDVEVEDGDPLDAVFRLGVAGADGDVVEQAEAAGNVGRGVVAGRTDRGESRPDPAFHHRLDAGHRGAGGAQHGFGAALAHHGVAVDMDMLAGPGPDAEDRLDIVLRMNARQLLHRGGGRGEADQAGKGRVVEGRQDGAQPVGPLGMVGAGVVLEERRMAHQKGRHGLSSSAPCGARTGQRGQGRSETRQQAPAEDMRRSADRVVGGIVEELVVRGDEDALGDLQGIIGLDDAFRAVGQRAVADQDAEPAGRQVVGLVGRDRVQRAGDADRVVRPAPRACP